ncbi:iron-containing redox enzyme family protein [Nocardia sp. XZ_19_385]|uniref:iron-containing redox enzyme family protein n=1 Tax=Nocardia sp. XZ_19_385 TaxID=2769488 RepID=UPI00188F6C12|nr:iron-containing redox enzyme family protein [Nocardia sp. XZ_19_385]
MTSVRDTALSFLPEPRGEMSEAVVELLRRPQDSPVNLPVDAAADPFGEDLQLALHTCYELHYRGFETVAAGWEWNPDLLRFRATLEKPFLAALRDEVAGGSDIDAELDQLLVEPVESTGISHYLLDEGEWWQVREYFVHRSIYHHKEADPQAWVIPRLRGQAKASLVAVEFDEFGGGRGERVHAQLFADLLAGAGLDRGYLHYLDVVPAPMLVEVNMMSLFGLHRELRGALVGQFAEVEITSPTGSRRMVDALERFGADPACVRFYSEHVEADAVHEQVLRRDVIGTLLAEEPGLTESVVFGIQATNWVADRFADHVLEQHWRQGRTSLRREIASD